MKKILSLLLSVSLLGTSATYITAEPAEAPANAETKQGDVNGDGKIDAADLMNIVKFFFGSDTSAAAFDVNGDGKVNILDFIECKKTVVDTLLSADFTIVDGVLQKYTGKDKIVRIPESVTEIADHAFWSNNYIEAVYVPGTVKKIGNEVFWSCCSLEFLDIAEGVESLGSSVCWCCPSLKDINLPGSIKELPRYNDCFGNCAAVRFHLPENSTGTLAEKAVKGTWDHNAEGGYAPYYSDHTYASFEPTDKSHWILPESYEHEKFTSFTIPEGTDYIGACAFHYCEQLTEITIPGSVKGIGGDAFEYCKALKKVYIEDGCESIGDGAFEYCRELREITIPASVTSIMRTSLDYCHDSLVIHCKEGSYAESYAKKENISYDHNISSTEPVKPVTTAVTTTKPVTSPAVSTTKNNVTTPVSTAVTKPVTTVAVTTSKPVTTVTPAVTKPVTTVTAQVKFNIKNVPTFSVSSENLNGGKWDAIISNTEKGSNSSPQLSWEPVENTGTYVIYMVDTSAGNWMHWRSGNIAETKLKTGWASSNEYIGPYPPSGTHTYVVYVFALKKAPAQLKGNFDDENNNFSDIISSLDKDSNGQSGNMISYGKLSGTYRR